MAVVVGIGVIFGFYTIYKKLNQLTDKMITKQAPPARQIEHQFIQKSPSPIIDWMEDLIQVHAATCNDRELSSKSSLYFCQYTLPHPSRIIARHCGAYH
jgi:hypothetical protein